MDELHGFTLGGALGVATVAFVIVGVVAWLLRRRWKSPFGPALLPAGVLAGLKILVAGADPLGFMQYALVDVFVGLVWWMILAWRDGRPRGRDAAAR